MRKLLPVVFLLAAACGGSVEPEEDSPLVIINDDQTSTNNAVDPDAPTDPVTEPNGPTEQPCEDTSTPLELPAEAAGVATWHEGESILASWVEPTTDSSGTVKWARFDLDGGFIDAPRRVSRARLADAPNFPAGNYATSISVLDETVFVAWHTSNTIQLPDYAEPTDHGMVLMSAFRADGSAVVSSVQVSDERYDSYEVDATMPIVRPRDGEMVIAWHDERLNEPRRYGQQGWPRGIYESTYDTSGNMLTWDEQIQQSPSIGWGRSFDFGGDGYVFLMGRDPHLAAFQGATQDEPTFFDGTMFGNPRAIAAHDGPSRLVAWVEDAAGDIVTVMNGDGETVMLDRVTDLNTSVQSVRWLRASDPAVVAWTVQSGPETDRRLEVHMAEISPALEVSNRGSTALDATGWVRLLDGRQRGDVLEALAWTTSEDAANQLELVQTCIDQPSPTYRWHEARQRVDVDLWDYETETMTMEIAQNGTVRGVWLEIESEGPRPEKVVEHADVSASGWGVFNDFDGMDVAGEWTVTVDSGDYGWSFNEWKLRFLLQDE